MIKSIIRCTSLLLFLTSAVYAAESVSEVNPAESEHKAKHYELSDFLYRPSFIQPFYYSSRPDTEDYLGKTPYDQPIKKYDLKFQLSIQLPVWREMFGSKTDIDVAYTQISYWQLYQQSAFFRETNYEPELIIRHKFSKFINLEAAINHQSNGRGGEMERSWNRVIASCLLGNDTLFLYASVWRQVLGRDSIKVDNPQLLQYMGYGRLLFGFKAMNNIVTVQVNNFIESSFRRGTVNSTWSFPIYGYYRGYVSYFRGYGQSLYEYKHFTNSVGVGITLNDWMWDDL